MRRAEAKARAAEVRARRGQASTLSARDLVFAGQRRFCDLRHSDKLQLVPRGQHDVLHAEHVLRDYRQPLLFKGCPVQQLRAWRSMQLHRSIATRHLFVEHQQYNGDGNQYLVRDEKDKRGIIFFLSF